MSSSLLHYDEGKEVLKFQQRSKSGGASVALPWSQYLWAEVAKVGPTKRVGSYLAKPGLIHGQNIYGKKKLSLVSFGLIRKREWKVGGRSHEREEVAEWEE